MAYISPAYVVAVNPVTQQGTQDIVIEFRGDTGEPPRQFDYRLDESSTNAVVRRWVYDKLLQLNTRKANVNTATVGQPIPQLAPPSDPAPTLFEIWREKALRLARLKALGLTAAAATADRDALQADVDATYVDNYADQL